MISGDFSKCKDLKTFYQEIVKLHEEKHGEGYCDVHDAIREALSPYGKRYVELGVNQGASLAAAALAGCESINAFDKNVANYQPNSKFFVDLGFRVNVSEGNSIKVKRVLCDVLYIDTLHNFLHLAKELAYWHAFVQETIIIHDTHEKQDMQRAIRAFVAAVPGWSIKEQNKTSVGYTVLEKNES